MTTEIVTTERLPEKLSDCIFIALGDLEKTEADERYEIDMGIYHSTVYPGEEVCMVCFAGSVMAKSLNVPFRDVSTTECGEYNSCRLKALDNIQMGRIGDAVQKINQEDVKKLPREMLWLPTPEYRDDKDAFKAKMREIAVELQKLGL